MSPVSIVKVIFFTAKDLQAAWHLHPNQASLDETILATGINFAAIKPKASDPESFSSATHRDIWAYRILRGRQDYPQAYTIIVL